MISGWCLSVRHCAGAPLWMWHYHKWPHSRYWSIGPVIIGLAWTDKDGREDRVA